MSSNSMYMRNLRSFVRRSAGPLLGIWLIACVLERLVMEFIFRSRGEDALGVWQLLTSMQALKHEIKAAGARGPTKTIPTQQFSTYCYCVKFPLFGLFRGNVQPRFGATLIDSSKRFEI